MRWEGNLAGPQSNLGEEKYKKQMCPTCALGQGASSPLWRWGGPGREWGGSDILGTRTFPELLLCTHGGGGCHLLYLTLSLPLQLLNRQSPELGASGDEARVSRTMIGTLKSVGCNSETTLPWSAYEAWSSKKSLRKQPRPNSGWGGRGDETRDFVVLKFTCDPDGDQSWSPKDVSGSCSARRETCWSSQFLFESFLP